MEVQYSGMGLDIEQRGIVRTYSDSFCKGCGTGTLHINVKEHRKAGDRFSYTIQLKAGIHRKDKRILEMTAEATDWDFQTSVKQAFEKLEKEVKSRQGSFFSRFIRLRRNR